MNISFELVNVEKHQVWPLQSLFSELFNPDGQGHNAEKGTVHFDFFDIGWIKKKLVEMTLMLSALRSNMKFSTGAIPKA